MDCTAYTIDALDFARDMFVRKFGEDRAGEFEKYFVLYEQIPAFKASENIHEISTDYSHLSHEELVDSECNYIRSGELLPEVHWIMRSLTQYWITQAFKAMRIDLNDPNIAENALGKGTPGRIAKMWVGNDPEDITELGSGRWNKEPAISYFPNTDNNRNTITKVVDVVSCCSHHFLPFSTFDGGTATISYKPGKYILGISKLQRFVTWAAKRFWLQEDLTTYIGETIKRIAKTEDVCVVIEGVVHGCEKFRGASAHNGSLKTEFRSGCFKED